MNNVTMPMVTLLSNENIMVLYLYFDRPVIENDYNIFTWYTWNTWSNSLFQSVARYLNFFLKVFKGEAATTSSGSLFQ